MQYPDGQLAEIAEIAHRVNQGVREHLGQGARPDWNKLPIGEREGIKKGAANVLTNPDMGPEDSHNGWMRSKLDLGWTYGPE